MNTFRRCNPIRGRSLQQSCRLLPFQRLHLRSHCSCLSLPISTHLRVSSGGYAPISQSLAFISLLPYSLYTDHGTSDPYTIYPSGHTVLLHGTSDTPAISDTSPAVLCCSYMPLDILSDVCIYISLHLFHISSSSHLLL